MLSVYVSSLRRQVGKTTVAAGLAGTMQSLSYAVSYYKPIQTGAPPIDENFINKIDNNIKTSTSYAFEGVQCPLISSFYAGVKKLDLEKIYNDYKNNVQMTECHIIEGANGLSAPIDEKFTEIDLASGFGLPILLVVNPNCESLDEVICGINYINSKKVDFAGVIVNSYDENSENIEKKYFPQLIQQYTKAKILGQLPLYDNYSEVGAETLIANTLHCINLEEIFGLKIAKLS